MRSSDEFFAKTTRKKPKKNMDKGGRCSNCGGDGCERCKGQKVHKLRRRELTEHEDWRKAVEEKLIEAEEDRDWSLDPDTDMDDFLKKTRNQDFPKETPNE